MEETQGNPLQVKVFKYQLAYCEDGENWLGGTGKKAAGFTGLFKSMEKSTVTFTSDEFNRGMHCKKSGGFVPVTHLHRKVMNFHFLLSFQKVYSSPARRCCSQTPAAAFLKENLGKKLCTV